MKKILYLLILAAFFSPDMISAEPDHGPVFKGFYAPYGAGSYTVPYDKNINGGSENTLASGSLRDCDNSLKTLKGYSFSCGYFYDWFQCDISYSMMKTDNLIVEHASTPGNEHSADADLWNADIRAGYRFSNPGDTSYKWLYLGVRRSELEISFNNTSAEATGFMAGFYGFSSFGLSGPFEFVLTWDLYAVGYRYNWNKFHSDVYVDVSRKFAMDLGLSGGIGVQYEPWDLAVVFKVSPFIAYRKYEEEDTVQNRETEAALGGTLIGIEIIFSIPEYKNNIVE
ncbi:MAG TPA: hypothetical protein P5120_15020 [Spirochaetota bacterium]|nr:hypothetical protein [Spirochaetota bacterium]HPJ42554.1 hypothetical protein [Spirochaetota bacterium]HPR37458.1 hypothetical protein [Spirochaetota bacterium]HRX48830.1 hypothetical protein [Spirochaetota bacterium]